MKKSWTLVAATVISSPLLAQDSSRVLDPVVVTANKIEQKQSTTGKVITVISREDIGRSAGKTLAQLLNEQAGVTINGALNNAGSIQTVFMRGAASGRALILLDGIPMNDPSMINNEFDLNLFALENIESIEICRGAQSTLYGSDAVAGVINIITVKKDVRKPLNATVSLSAGNYGTFRGGAQVYGKANRLTYSARHNKQDIKGFSSAYDKAGNKEFDKDGFYGDMTDARLQYQLTTALSLKGFFRYSRYKTAIDNGAFTDGRDYTSTNKNLNAGGGFHYQNDAVSVTGNYQYSDIKRLLFNDSLDSPGNLARNDYYGKTQFAEIYATIRIGQGFSLLQGADFRHHTINQQNFGTYPASQYGPAGSFSSQLDSVASQASLYASLLYHSTGNRLHAELGGRLNVHSRYGSNYTYTFNPSYRINDHFRLFGSIASAFKTPSLYQLYSQYGDRNLKPERSVNYELGIQQQHNIISNRLVWFYRTIKDGIDYNNNFPSRYFNFIKQEVSGLEYETTLRLSKALTVSANYTWLHIDERTQSRQSFKDTSYTYALKRPEHSINLQATYAITRAFTISAQGKYVSGRYDVGGYKTYDVELGDYFIFGAYAEYLFTQRYKVYLNTQNITDKKFFDISGYNSIPFTITGGIIVNL